MKGVHWSLQAAAYAIGAILLVASQTILIWSAGYCLQTLWGWFSVPVFALPALTLLQAIGVDLVVSVIVQQTRLPRHDDGEKIAGSHYATWAIRALARPWLFLLVGYVVRWLAVQP